MLDYKNLWNLEPETRELFSSTDTVTKDKIVSFRMEESLYFLLEAFAERMNYDSIGKAVRNILSMYFIPEVYRFEIDNLKPEKLEELIQHRTQAGEPVSFDRFRLLIKFIEQYSEFLKEAEMKSLLSLKFIEQETEKVEKAVSMLEEVQETWNKLLEEKEKDNSNKEVEK